MKAKSKIRYDKDPDGHYIIPACVAKNKDLTDSSKRVLSYIFSLWGTCETVHPSLEKIAEMTFLNKTSVVRALKQLSQLGILKIQKGKGRGNANNFQVMAERTNEFLGVELCETNTSNKKDEHQDELYEMFRKIYK